MANSASEPTTLKDRIIGSIIALGLGALGAFMFIHPDYTPTSSGTGRARTRVVIWILEHVWGRTAGVVLVLLAVLILLGVFAKNKSSDTTA